MRIAILVILLMTCTLGSGCGRRDRVVPPDVRINPHPVRAQRFHISVTGKTSQIADIQGNIQYNIADSSCVPIDHGMALGGVRPTFTKYATLKIVPLGHDKYEALVYRDLYAPSDYYGLGLCHWRITILNIRIMRTDHRKEIAGISHENLNYGAKASISCGPRVGGFGCAPSRLVSVDDYKLIVTSTKE